MKDDQGGEELNITSLSLIDTAECQTEELESKADEIYLQLMQFNEFGYTEALQYRIEIDRIIHRCRMFSRQNVLIDLLKRNSTTTRSLTFAGVLENDPYEMWENVAVQASIRITFKNFCILIKLSTNEIILPSEIRRPLREIST